MLNFRSLVAATCLLASASAHAYSQKEYGEAVGTLHDQLEKITRQSSRTCPQDHTPIFRGKDLKVALYYGYEDYEEVTADSVHAHAMAAVLQNRCAPNVVVCEFRVISRSRFETRLQKSINGKNVTIAIHSNSVTSSNSKNMNEKRVEQDRQSAKARAQFHRDLSQSDIVFYSGHSRYGGGLGFNSQTTGQALWENISRISLRDMSHALQVRPSRLKVFGLFACQTNQYYRIPVEERNPYINLIVSHDDINPDEGEQQSIGALNAILGQKCEAELRDSMVSTVEPGHKVLQYIRRPF